MQEELHQFERNKVWHLIPWPKDKSIIGTKWTFKNKLDEFETVTWNKTRLVVQGACKPTPGSKNHEFSNHVFKLDKALYGLKWYERLSKTF